MPPTNATSPSPSYPIGTKPGSMTVSHGSVPRPSAPPSNYQSYPGPRPPMYPGPGMMNIFFHSICFSIHLNNCRQHNKFMLYNIVVLTGGQPPSGWQHRYPSYPPSGYGPQNGPRGPTPPGQWGPQSERNGSYPAYGPKPPGSWGPSTMQGQPGMRPPYRPDMRGPGSIPRPVSRICILKTFTTFIFIAFMSILQING